MTSAFLPDLSKLPHVAFSDRQDLPAEAGIYFALSSSNEVMYVGRTVNIARRWAAHHRAKQLADMNCARLAWLTVSDPELLAEIEAALITHFQPALNGTPQEGVPNSLATDYPRGTVGYFWNQVRLAMASQPRGYQAHIAEQLGVERSYISRFVKGEYDLSPKYQQAVLDSLGLEISLKSKQAKR